jgi:hypothetical protein
MATITVEQTYQGIPGIAHGGYAAGLLAQRFDEPVRVALRRPPPLETPLTVNGNSGMTSARDPAGRLVMEAEPIPAFRTELPSLTVQQMARQAPHPGFDRHPYPVCFVCGTDRTDGFGLRIGAAGDGLSGGVWTPSGLLLPSREVVPPAFVWAVVDCVTAWTFADHWNDPDWWPALTGQLAVTLTGAVRRERDHVVAGRVLRKEGRRIVIGAVVQDDAGRSCAHAEATWIVVPSIPGRPH